MGIGICGYGYVVVDMWECGYGKAWIWKGF